MKSPPGKQAERSLRAVCVLYHLPHVVKVNFKEAGGEGGRHVLVFKRSKKQKRKGDSVIRFACSSCCFGKMPVRVESSYEPGVGGTQLQSCELHWGAEGGGAFMKD